MVHSERMVVLAIRHAFIWPALPCVVGVVKTRKSNSHVCFPFNRERKHMWDTFRKNGLKCVASGRLAFPYMFSVLHIFFSFYTGYVYIRFIIFSMKRVVTLYMY